MKNIQHQQQKKTITFKQDDFQVEIECEINVTSTHTSCFGSLTPVEIILQSQKANTRKMFMLEPKEFKDDARKV